MTVRAHPIRSRQLGETIVIPSIEVESPPSSFAMGRAGTIPQANPHHDRVSDRLFSVLGRLRVTNVSGRFI